MQRPDTCFSLQGSLRRPRIQRALVLLLLESAQQSGLGLVAALVLALVLLLAELALAQ